MPLETALKSLFAEGDIPGPWATSTMELLGAAHGCLMPPDLLSLLCAFDVTRSYQRM